MNKGLFTLTTVVILAGCGQEVMPEPNAATCAQGAFQAALEEMRSETNRAAFIEECRSFHKSKNINEWKFTPSPKDDY
ncbi:MAG: entry exclusion lipoprotein TrbK [Burkholderiaceae bacterium]|nr:entry exclusion lipoprotein TrbK [Burkholderiaceae bacterium]